MATLLNPAVGGRVVLLLFVAVIVAGLFLFGREFAMIAGMR